jgi:hypothetical protein
MAANALRWKQPNAGYESRTGKAEAFAETHMR